MALARFLIQDSLGKVRFFEETFLLADISMEVVLEMPFLSLSNVDVKFAELEKLTWRTDTAVETLSIISRVKLIDKREFARVTLDKNLETFVIHVSALEAITIYPFRAAQIATL